MFNQKYLLIQNINTIKEKDVFLNYSLKTARYTFDCPLVVGAILAGAGKQDIQRLSEIGLLIGQAFQIQDDVIGIFDSQKNIGKSILSDLAESKKTLLVCHAYNTLPPPKRKNFMKYFSKTKKTYADLVAIRRIFLDAGSLHYCLQETINRINRSQKILLKLNMKIQYRRQIEKCLLFPFDKIYAITDKYGIKPELGGGTSHSIK